MNIFITQNPRVKSLRYCKKNLSVMCLNSPANISLPRLVILHALCFCRIAPCLLLTQNANTNIFSPHPIKKTHPKPFSHKKNNFNYTFDFPDPNIFLPAKAAHTHP